MNRVVSSTTPYGSLATMNASSARPTYSAWPLPRSARKICSGASAAAAPIATLPSKSATVRRNASVEVAAGGSDVSRHDGRDDLGIGGDRTGDAQAVLHLDVGVVVDVAVQRGDDVGRACASPDRSASSLFSGWQLGSLMMPTLAQRVWPSTEQPRRRTWRAPGAAARRPRSRRAARGCCRRARRSRPRPCRRS